MLEGVVRRKWKLQSSGVEIAALDWGGSGPLVLLHHANGLCGATWGLVAELLRDDLRLIAIDARGHGDSSRPEGPGAYGWDQLMRDLVGVAEQIVQEQGSPIAMAAGNSFGGTLSCCAAAERPDLFERVAMLDPVIRPTPEMLQAHGIENHFEQFRSLGPNFIAEQARRRRAVWPSREAARESWSAKDMFKPWDSRALDLYVAEGMRDRSDGQVELKCHPEVEAAVFDQNSSMDVFDYAERVRAPTLVVAAERGRFPLPLFEMLADTLPRGQMRALPVGHLMPMEDPKITADLLREFASEPL
jgi:pimeloyl-ACP methyl ester carboxylesterase